MPILSAKHNNKHFKLNKEIRLWHKPDVMQHLMLLIRYLAHECILKTSDVAAKNGLKG